MATSTISTRGQLTIPKEIREGDKVEFRREDGKLVLHRCRGEENPFLEFVGIGDPVPGGSVARVRWLVDPPPVTRMRSSNPDRRNRRPAGEHSPSRRMLTDFIIGSHATLHADAWMTDDVKMYRANFPELTLI